MSVCQSVFHEARPFTAPSRNRPLSGPAGASPGEEGKSRVVYLQLSHDQFAYENPNSQMLLANSIRWTANK